MFLILIRHPTEPLQNSHAHLSRFCNNKKRVIKFSVLFRSIIIVVITGTGPVIKYMVSHANCSAYFRSFLFRVVSQPESCGGVLFRAQIHGVGSFSFSFVLYTRKIHLFHFPANTDHDAALCSMLFTGMWNILL